MHMPDFYFEQLVTESFLDLVFGWVEDADLAIRQDTMNPLDVSGDPKGAIHRGGLITPTAAPSMAIRASAMYGTDPDGRRLYWSDEQQIDCTVDHLSVSTAVASPGNERYLGIFAEFDRELTEQKIDGNGVAVWTRQLESYSIKVYRGDEELIGAALPPATPAGAVRLCNVRLVYNQTQILVADIELDSTGYERDDWVRLTGTELGEFVHGNPSEAVKELFGWLDTVAGGGSTFTATATWHDGSSLSSLTTTAAINEILADLSATAGSDRIGGAAHSTTGGYCDLTAGSVQDQLRSVADNVDGHIGGGAPAHADTAVTAGAKAGSPTSLSTGSVGSQITTLLSAVNARARLASMETISGIWTHTSNLIVNSILRIGDGDEYYIRGDGSTSGKYYTLFRPNGGYSRLLYSGSTTGSIIWTFNCYWDHTNDVWMYDSGTTDSWAIRLSSSGLYLQRMDKDDPDHDSAGWADTEWSSTIKWGSAGGTYGMTAYPEVFNVAGNEIYDRVRISMGARNVSDSTARQLNGYVAASWHAKMTNGIVSGDATVGAIGSPLNWSTTPTIANIDEYGVALSGVSDSVTANNTASWHGYVELNLTV